MLEPFIFIGTHRIKEGMLEQYKRYTRDLVEAIEANEPRLIAFNAYLNEEGTQVTAIQVHPDAASMEFHLQLLGDKIAEAYDFLEKTESIQLYGAPSEALLTMMKEVAGSGVPLTVNGQHLVGFTRSAARD